MKEKSEENFISGHNACAGCGSAIAMKHIVEIAGKNSIITIATGCMEVVSTPYPLTAWKIPLIHSAFENVAATASGIESALKHSNKKTNVIAIAGDGGTADIGLQALSGAFERGHKFLFVCYDNESYSNTGVQRSSLTPKYASTATTPYGKAIHGNITWKKNMPFIMASHNANCYVATANIAFLQDFREKIKKALQHKGPSYIQVLCPCVPGWGIPTEKTIKIARLAVLTRAFLLYEIENGILKINLSIEKPQPIEQYLLAQSRFKKINKEEIEKIKRHVDGEYKKIKSLQGKKIF